MMRSWIVAATLAAGLGFAPPAASAPAVPMFEIVDTIRGLAAEQLGRKKSEIVVIQSLFEQGLDERGLTELVVAIEGEFGVVLGADEITIGKWNDPVHPLTVRRLAELVASRMPPQL
jgi:acyl carrier protein